MKYTFRIKKNYEFKRIFTKGQFFSGKILNIYFEVSKKSYNKFGVAISKKVGKSVIRNKLKRWAREVYKNNKYLLSSSTSFYMIISYKNNIEISQLDYHLIENDFLNLCKKAGIIEYEKDIN